VSRKGRVQGRRETQEKGGEVEEKSTQLRAKEKEKGGEGLLSIILQMHKRGAIWGVKKKKSGDVP